MPSILSKSKPSPPTGGAESGAALPRESHTVNSQTFELLHCPPGTFTMGSPEDEADRHDHETQHEVTLTRGFALGVFPVTQALWEAVTGENPSWFQDGDDAPQRPAEQVSWFDAVRFCNALSAQVGLAPAYTIGEGDEPSVTCDFGATGFRLPTESEWEYAARSGGDAFVYAGSDDLDEVGWSGKNSHYLTQSVGGKAATRWGVHDLSGNVWEWCWDVLADYAKGEVTDPTGAPTGPYRAARGGSWLNLADSARAAFRNGDYPGNRSSYLGFRLSRTIPCHSESRGSHEMQRAYLEELGVSQVDKAAVKAGRAARPTPPPPERTPPPKAKAKAKSKSKSSSPTGSAESGAALPRESHTVNSQTFELLHCPTGKFTMGSPEDEADRNDDETQHEVTLTRGFALGVFPVTQALWEAVTGENPSRFQDGDDAPQRPAEKVSWFDAVRFCNALSAQVGLAPAYTIGEGDEPSVTCDFGATGFRLPTESEWEYAARSGGDAFVYAGSDDLDEVGWSGKNSDDSTRPVGGKASTRWGMHDLSGNVLEWCWDVYADYAKGEVTDPTGAPTGPDRVLRGGAWLLTEGSARAAYRLRVIPGIRSLDFGFRLSRTIPCHSGP